MSPKSDGEGWQAGDSVKLQFEAKSGRTGEPGRANVADET